MKEASEALFARIERDGFTLEQQAYARRLVRVGGKQAIDLIARLIESKVPSVHQAAITVLGDVGGEYAIKQLVDKGLASAYLDTTEQTAKTLATLKDEAWAQLVDGLDDHRWSVQAGVAKTFGYIGDARAVELLIEALKGREPQVQVAVAQALGRIGDPRGIKPVIDVLRGAKERVYAGIVQALSLFGTQAVDLLIKALRHEDTTVRSGAIDALVEIDDEKGIESLLEALKEESLARSGAVKALARIGKPEPLIRVLRDGGKREQLAAIRSLKWMDRDRATGPLGSALLDETLTVPVLVVLKSWEESALRVLIPALFRAKEKVRLQIARYLRKYFSEAAATQLITILRASAEVGKRRIAVETLGELGAKAAVPALVKAALEDLDADVSDFAKLALSEIGSAGIKGLVGILRTGSPEKRHLAGKALLEIRGPEVVKQLVEVLENEREGLEARKTAAELLGELKDPGGVEGLISALSSPNRDVASASARALGIIGDPRAVMDLSKALRQNRNPEAARALAKIKNEQAISQLIIALRSNDEWVWTQAHSALIQIREGAVGQLVTAVEDKNEEVRRRICGVLAEIGQPLVKPLRLQLRSGSRRTREKAAQRLARRGLPVVQALIEMLREPGPVPEGVLEALQRIGKPAVPLLMNALRDPDASTQRRVAMPLGKMEPCPLEELIAALGDEEDERLRRGAILALAEISDWATKESTAARLADGLVKEDLPHKETQEALINLREAALQPLARALPLQKPRGQRLIGHILGNMKRVGLEPLEAMLYVGDPKLRRGAVQALGWIKGLGAARLLRVGMGDKDAQVREAVIDAFVKIGAADGEQVLIEALDKRDKWTRWTAAKALAEIGRERAIGALRRRQAKERVEEVKEAIEEALGCVQERLLVGKGEGTAKLL